MNTVTRFTQLRPDDEQLDEAGVDRIWREVLGNRIELRSPAASQNLHSVPPIRRLSRIDGGAEHHSLRRRGVVGAAAVVLLGLGFAVAQITNGRTTTLPGAGPNSTSVTPATTFDPASLVTLVVPTMPAGFALVGSNPPTVRTEPSGFQVRVYGAEDDPGDPSRMVRLEYTVIEASVIPCFSFMSISTDVPMHYSATEWMDGAIPIEDSTPFAIGTNTGAYCVGGSGLLQAGWFTDNVGVSLIAGAAVAPSQLIEFAQSLVEMSPTDQLEGRPSVDLVADPVPAGWTALVSEDVPFTQHVTETSWVASPGGRDGEPSQFVVQSWIGVDEQGVFAKHAPIYAERVTIRGHDGYRYVSAARGANGPLEIMVWWTEVPGVVVSVWANDTFETDEFMLVIEQMTPVDLAGYEAFTGRSGDVSATTEVVTITTVVPVGAVVCLDAGAGQSVTDLCVQEWGGESFASAKTGSESFVMPVDPSDALHQSAAERVAGALGLPLREFDAAYFPTGVQVSEEVQVFVVLGTSPDPVYLPPPDTTP